MSGFVVGFGAPGRKEVESMFEKIRHRGPHASGIFEKGRVIMAQNYLRADGAGQGPGGVIPLAGPDNNDLRICYDGQFGNLDVLLGEYGIGEGAFGEERLILEMYTRFGSGLFKRITDAVFTFVISDGEDLLACRDLLGIKTLFYGWKDGTLYLASELKSITGVTEDVHEFPAGHFMNSRGELTRFANLPEGPPEYAVSDVGEMTERIREIINRSFGNRVTFDLPTGSLLSGGIDSSVICFLASEAYRKKFGGDARLRTFSLGVGESEDIHKARVMAEHLGTEHHELIVELKDLLDVLPEVIYHLESFDPALVRSSTSNFLISRHARKNGIEVLLSGEGGDEVFCGYSHLKALPPEELFKGQIEALGFLHSNASLRLDRMNQCNSIRVVTPLISGELLDYSLSIPPEYKVREQSGEMIEKWIFRKAFEGLLPDSILWRIKQEFSQGSGSDRNLPAYFDEKIGDAEFEKGRKKHPMVRSKEELHYLGIFIENFGEGKAVETVGQWPRV